MGGVWVYLVRDGIVGLGGTNGEVVMVIEWLKFRVPVADQPRDVATDAQVWTACLAAHPRVLSNEVWSAVDDPEALNLVIRWESMAAWKAVPQAALDAADAAFRVAMGAVYPVLGCVAYKVI